MNVLPCLATNYIFLDLVYIVITTYLASLLCYYQLILLVLNTLTPAECVTLFCSYETNRRLLFILVILFAYCCKRNAQKLSIKCKMKINNAPFFLISIFFLLFLSGIEQNPGPRPQLYDVFSNSNKNPIVAHLNVQNLLSQNGTKLDEIALFLKKSAQTPLVLGLSETWLSERNATALFTFENFHQPFRKDRNVKINGRLQKGGGILVYVSKFLQAKRRRDLESQIETIWVEILDKHQSHFLICNFYRPPQSKKCFFDILHSQIEKAQEYGLPLFLLGDLNVDLLNAANPNLPEISKWQKSFDLVQLIASPTRITTSSSTLIDHIYCSNLKNVIEAKSRPCHFSDHNMIYCRIKRSDDKISKPTTTRLRRDYKKISDDNLIMFFSNVHWNDFYSKNDVNQKWLWLQNLLLSARDSLAPGHIVRIQQRHQVDEWETEEIRVLRRQCNLALYKWKKTRGLEERLAFFRVREDFERKKLDAKSLFYRNKCAVAKNSKDRWRTLNFLLGRATKSTSCKALVYEGKNICMQSDIANTFNSFFTKIGSLNPLQRKLSLDKILASCTSNGFRFHTVSPPTVLRLLSTLNVSKPAGPDELAPEFLKKVAIYIYQPLTHLFNQCLNENAFPELWKLANVTPVYKKGISSDPSNYRPISVTSVVSKTFEKIICLQMSNYLETNDLINPNQFGYRQNLSTEDAIVKLVEDMKNAMNKRKHTAVVFLDLSKAFDTVQHDILLQQLSKLKLSVGAVSLISNYLSNRKQRTRVGSEYSHWLPLTSGVPQGSLLGPLLFLVYVNDVGKNIIKSKVISYADDTALYFSSESKDDLIRGVNADLAKLLQNLNNLSLKVNINKTKLLLLSNCNTNNFRNVKIGSKTLESVSETDYLGVTIDNKLSFKNQVHKVISKIALANSSISHISKLVNKSTRKLLCDTLVNSQLYCSTVWQYCTDRTVFEKFLRQQNRSLRIIENRHITQGVQDLKNSGEYVPFEVLMAVNSVKFLHKLVRHDKFQSYHLQLAPRHRNSFGIQVQNCRLNIFRSSLQHKGAKIWNSLDPPIRKIKSPRIFKIKAREFLLQQYISNASSMWSA